MGLADMATFHVVMTYTTQENDISIGVDDALTICFQNATRHGLEVQLRSN